jgi:hypothetical protein
MKKDPRDWHALVEAPELAEVSGLSGFRDIKVEDLRKLAELIRDFAGGSISGITIETASEFGGSSRHRLQCAKRALRDLVGKEHPATESLKAALSMISATKRRGTRHKDDRPRVAVLNEPRWDNFRSIEATLTMPLNELRAVDRFMAFSEAHGRGTETDDFLAFVADQESSMLLRTLRGGLEKLLTPAHPAIMAVEQARSIKEAERYQRRKPEPTAEPQTRALRASVARDELPSEWLGLLDKLLSGKPVRGRKLSRKTVSNMTGAARQMIYSAREEGLPDAINLETIAAYDKALEHRGVRASSRQILFASLQTFAKRLGLDRDLVRDLADLVGHYERASKRDVKVKEGRLADLPDLQAIFEKANSLLDEAPSIMDRRSRTTQYVDAAALPFLSLIPLRNADTLLHWGKEIRYIGDDDPSDWGLDEQGAHVSYYLDLRTSKTDSALSGPLAPILTPFLDALILRGQDERMLPDLRKAIMRAQAPVFPKSNGKVRSIRNLSNRWHVHLGTGSVISRTRIHTLLGALGARGTRAALALCAQSSQRTARWYEAVGLERLRMSESQDMVAAMIEMDEEAEALLALL